MKNYSSPIIVKGSWKWAEYVHMNQSATLIQKHYTETYCATLNKE